MLISNVVIPTKTKELSENKIGNTQAHIPTTEFENLQITQNAPLLTTTDEGSYSMPFLDAQARRVMELGYCDRIPPQNFVPPTSIERVILGKTVIPSLGCVKLPGNIDSKFSGPNMYTLDQKFQYYHTNFSMDYVDQLAPHDPAMALWQKVREVAKSICED